MSMSDWRPNNMSGNEWVYYVYAAGVAAFRALHMSRNPFDVFQDHMATNDNQYYYYGNTNSFNTPNMPQNVRDTLVAAWRDFYTVQ
jgi:hypothetical protein